jgi:hypothetical protein
MNIVRTAVIGISGLFVTGLLASVSAQHEMPMSGGGMPMPKTMMTREQKIANAMSAAPSSVSANATILDWPAKEGDVPPVLRSGKNGWSCLPDMPMTEGNDPMCLDASWMKWVEGFMAKKAPQYSTAGIGYMMAPGGGQGSNTDPFAMTASADNQWAHHPPHMMILVPDLKSLEGLTTDPHNGGPYVMFKGTPFAHIMAPVAVASPMKH